jgi:mRNA deadenylase 3'-5' endonuclease subunit Ccr4
VDKDIYMHLPSDSQLWDWGYRKGLLIDEILSQDADIVCLQEVEFTAFENDFNPAMEKAGYSGRIQQDKRRSENHAQGVATFWRNSRFLSQSDFSKTRTYTVVLKDTQATHNPLLAVINVHLEGHPLKCVERCKQLKSALAQLNNDISHHGVLVCGDFNCQMGSSSSSAYLAMGKVPLVQGQVPFLEWGREVSPDAAKITTHPYKTFSSAYEPSRAIQANVMSLGEEFTFSTRPGNVVDGLDQVWYTDDVLKLQGVKPYFKSKSQQETILKNGLPHAVNGSDHISVGATFSWSIGSSLQDLKGAALKGAGPKMEDLSVEQLTEQVNELVIACPITDEEMEEFNTVTAIAPKSKGKPSPEELAAFKDLRLRKEALLRSVSDEAGQMLRTIFTARKRIAKLQKKR